ncbi:MAG: hypothetical protein K8963_04840, partial [Proteobacteria bacterium]|nr:hypothetical protein [Pseudomonadota bacterium]
MVSIGLSVGTTNEGLPPFTIRNKVASDIPLALAAVTVAVTGPLLSVVAVPVILHEVLSSLKLTSRPTGSPVPVQVCGAVPTLTNTTSSI